MQKWQKAILKILAAWALLPSSLIGMINFAQYYPYCYQQIVTSAFYTGDRHEEFQGDMVALLTDGSAWKVHPSFCKAYSAWQAGETVHVRLRDSHYWFKREHQFELFNDNRQEAVAVMLVGHKESPPLFIHSISMYAKSQSWVTQTDWVEVWHDDGTTESVPVQKSKLKPCDYRQIIQLTDGSCWVIKDCFQDFQIGQRVYVGAQGRKKRFYDFVLISGDQREAVWTWARPQK